MLKVKQHNEEVSPWRHIRDRIIVPAVILVLVGGFIFYPTVMLLLQCWEFWLELGKTQAINKIAVAYVADHCLDDAVVRRTNISTTCDEKKATAEEWPSVRAFFNILYQINLCGEYGCKQMLAGASKSYVVNLVVGSILLYYAIVFGTSFGLFSFFHKKEQTRYDLPGDNYYHQKNQ